MMIKEMILTVWIACILCSLLSAASQVVWEIGIADNNCADLAPPPPVGGYFSQTVKYPDVVQFQTGVDNPQKAWPAVQPGPIDDWAGSRVHPFTVLFNLPQEPKGVFTLILDFQGIHPQYPPLLEIQVNGHDGSILLPKTPTSYDVLHDAAKGKQHLVQAEMDASIFKPGENRMIITAEQGGWVVYDALSLVNDPARTSGRLAKSVTLQPTLRFVRRESKLQQVLELAAEFSPGLAPIEATLKIAAQTMHPVLQPDIFGGCRQEIYIDEVKKPEEVILSLELQGQLTQALCRLNPERHWKVFIQGSDHVDIGFTDTQENIKKLHNQITTKAVATCELYPDFKWNTEASWVVDNYLSMTPREEVETFLRLAREGRIGIQAFYGSMLSGNLSHEEMIRAMSFTNSLRAKYGIPCDHAMSCDVPTFTGSLPTILAGSGIRYFSAGLSRYRADSFNQLYSLPFYWQGPDGSRVLTFWHDGYGDAGSLGLWATTRSVAVELEERLRIFDRRDYPCDAILIFGATSDNLPNPPLATMARVAKDWNAKYAYPQILFNRGPEFFTYLEAACKDKLKTIKGGGGAYWEDGVGSTARETALNRIAKEELVTAEKLHSLNALLGNMPYPATELEEAWKNAVLFDEHTWGADCSVRKPEDEMTTIQWNYKAGFARQAKTLADSISNRGLVNLAQVDEQGLASILVFNPHSWPVSGLVQIAREKGTAVPYWVQDVPALGYHSFPQGTVTACSTHPLPAGTTLENRYYRLELDPSTGAVRKLFDKELGCNLVDGQAKYGLNQFLYISGYRPYNEESAHTGIVNLKPANFTDSTRAPNALPVTITREDRGYGQVAKVTGSALNIQVWTSEIILYNDAKRIDFQNIIHKKLTYEKEAGYFAFPFAIDEPVFRLSQPNGVLRPDLDLLPGGCMQWYTALDYVAIAGKNSTVIWSAIDSPLVTLGDINRETFQSPLPITNSHLYAYVFNNYWDVNYRAGQEGELQFRFSMTSAGTYDSIAATRFGATVRNPLIATRGRGRLPQDAGVYHTASLLSLSSTNVVVQAIKQAQSGDGFIIRLREIGGKDTPVTVKFPIFIPESAWSCDLLEKKKVKLEIMNNSLEVMVPSSGLVTIWIK